MSSSPKFYLVDVSSMFFRAFYAIRPLSSPSGVPTNAIYGFLSMLIKLVKQDHPHYLVFCYDRKEPSFRRDIYAEYKANRTEMPEDLVPQIPYIKKLADVLGVPSLEVESFEADDIIGTLAIWAQKQGCDVSIVSGDKDFGQLIRPGIVLYDTMKEIRYDSAGVIEKWGIRPDQVIDYLALVGDASDNVPGVAGIGPKTAQKLLAEYDSLDGVYKNLEAIKGSTQEKIRQGKELAYLSQKLVTISLDVPVPGQLSEFSMRETNRAELTKLLQELNFKNLEKTLVEWPFQATGSSPSIIETPLATPIQTTATASVPATGPSWREEPLTAAQAKKRIASDSLLWALPMTNGIFLGDSENAVLYRCQGEPQEWGKLLSELKIRWRGFGLKDFWHQVHMPLEPRPLLDWDSELAAYIVKPGASMEWARVVERTLQSQLPELPTASEYWNLQLAVAAELRQEMEKYQGDRLLQTMDAPLEPLLFQMETRGIRLDVEALKQQSLGLQEEIKILDQKIRAEAGEDFNIASTKQLAVILFEKLKLPPGKKTKTGFSTDNEVLESLKDQHPIIDLVLQYRELTKLKSTYVDALPLLVKADGRLHTTFDQALTATGRLSSNDPNLQNIPIRTERGARVRRAFVAEPGNILLSVDYSQIELRILAHFSGDANLGRAFADDLDVHALTAAEVFGVDLADVTSQQRRTAKAVNFGIAYGQGAFGLAETLGLSRTEASEIIARYFHKFPGVRSYIDSTIELAKKQGFVETLYGRRRYMDELKSASPAIRKFGERAAINAPIQGTASDIVKLAMVSVSTKSNLPMLLQVHDELIFEGPEDQVRAEEKRIVELMENVVSLKVPLKANASIGVNWDQAH